METTTTKRVRKISGERGFKLMRRFKVIIGEIYMIARTLKLTHEDIQERVREQVTGTPEWARLSLHYRYYVEGYHEALQDEIWRSHLVWMKWCDNQLLTSDEMRALTEKEFNQFSVGEDYPKFPVDYRSPWARCEEEHSRFVWKDAAGNPMKDKPFERKYQ